MKFKLLFLVLTAVLSLSLPTFAQEKVEMVQLVYFFPKDHLPAPSPDKYVTRMREITTELNKLVNEVRDFYFHEMGKTFDFNKKVEFYAGKLDRAGYLDNKGKISKEKIIKEIDKDPRFDLSRDIYLIATNMEIDTCGTGRPFFHLPFLEFPFGQKTNKSWAIFPFPQSVACVAMGVDLGFIVAHELGHAFGLKHDFRTGDNIMSYNTKKLSNQTLSRCAAEWLDVCRAFNFKRPGFSAGPIKILGPNYSLKATDLHISFELRNILGGLHSAQLHVSPTIVPQGFFPELPTRDRDAGWTKLDPYNRMTLYHCESLNNNKATIQFVYSKINSVPITDIQLSAIDKHGNLVQKQFKVPNYPPMIGEPIEDIHLRMGTSELLDLSKYFWDPNGNALTYKASSNDRGVATVKRTGTQITIIPEGEGSTTIIVRGIDPNGLYAEQHISVTVTDVANQTPITVNTIAPQNLTLGSSSPPLDVSAYFRDPDGNTLTYTVESSNPAVATTQRVGSQLTVWTWDTGRTTVTVKATDSDGLYATQTFTVTVTGGTAQNQPPEAVNTIPLQALLLDASPETVDVAQYFSSQNELIYEAESNPRGIVTESVSGSRVTIRPKQLGSTSVIVTARDTDNRNLYAIQTIPVLVYTNRATIVRPPPDPTFHLPTPASPVGLKIGDSVITQLTPGFTLAVRPAAGTNNIPRERIGRNIIGTIERGPRSNEGFTWWYIEWDIRGQNLEGWSVEADRGQILFRRPPDLEIQDLDVSKDAVEPGETFKIEVRIHNKGPGESAPTAVYCYYSPNRHSDVEELDADSDNLRVAGKGTLKVPSLRAGSSSEVSLSVEAPMTPDRYYYGAFLPSNIHETDYKGDLNPDVLHNNLARERRVEVTSSPDLIVESVSASESTLDPGERFKLEATVRNQGIGEPERNATLRYYLSSDANISERDTKVDEDTVSRTGLDPSETEWEYLTAPTEPGIYYYGACVYLRGESNTSNNCSSAVAITVRAPEPGQTPAPVETPDPPDLIVESRQQPAQTQTAGAIYWTDWDTNKIQRANLNGSNVQDLVTTGLGSPYGIALDVAGGKMYWADAGTAKIQRANLDGSNIQNLIPLGLGVPICIALDVTGNKMYWTDRGTGKIQRANLDGSNMEDLVFGVRGLHGIALDVAGNKMYWTDNEASKIQRANLDGTTIEDLVTTGLQLPNEIVLDVAAGKMYWVDDGTRRIQRANLDGTGVQNLVTTGLHTPVGITLDSIGGKMYWTDLGTRRIQRANLDGTGVQNLVTTGLNAPFGITLGTSLTFSPPVIAREDVNNDGIVDAQDVVLVDQNKLDLNGDGVSDIADILLVVKAMGNAGGAPAARSKAQHLLTAEKIQQWLIEAMLLGEDFPIYQRGILVLEQLLALLTPKKTALLPNYPNPFNPETWIPYQIAEPTNVTLHIYATNGHLVRTLILGHQPAGIYHNRNRAAYWDGRNELGEPVASGIYFYTLSAGNFTATRRLLIRK